jgi:hypothetical protein
VADLYVTVERCTPAAGRLAPAHPGATLGNRLDLLDTGGGGRPRRFPKTRQARS